MKKSYKKMLIKRFGLKPDFQVKEVLVLTVSATFLCFDTKGNEYWKDRNGDIIVVIR